MKKLGFLMFMLALALMLGGTALAQNVGDGSFYFTTYYANNVTAAPDATRRIINDGYKGLRDLWASHIQSVANKNPYGPAPYSQTETALADSNLGAPEELLLENLCFYDKLLSGKNCNCTPEDLDF